MTNPKSINKAIEESKCHYVIHCASPFPLESPKTEAEIVEPAVIGTTAVMKSAFHAGWKGVVVTSSCAAIEEFSGGKNIEVDETNWHNPDGGVSLPYYKSKVMAEKAAWDFYDSIDAKHKETFTFNTVHPGFVTGPVKVKLTGTSQSVITGIFNGAITQFPHLYTSVVDIRDVASAHVKALTICTGKRLVLSTGNYSFTEIVEILQKEYNDKGYNIRFSNPPLYMLWIFSVFGGDVRFYYRRWGLKWVISPDNTKKILGVENYIPLEQSLKDMAESLMDLGYVERKEAK